jgi:UDP-GlcNAc3NAcA epimerase
MMRVLSIVGARPQFVKAAMICAAVRRHNQAARGDDRIQHRLLHTGQHYDRAMSDVFFEQLPLPRPHYQLGVGSGSHGEQTAAMLQGIEGVLLKHRPDIAVIYGDTNSTVAGALAAAKLHIPVAHVEAGLRSFNRRMPEELNRVAADHLSDLLLCPTATSMRNLKHEGLAKQAFLTGDVMLDAAMSFRQLSQRRQRMLTRIGVLSGDYTLVTIHRAENTDDASQLESLVEILTRLQTPVVFPMHPRLRARLEHSRGTRALQRKLLAVSTLHIIDPVSYLDMLLLESNARLVMTDSGGVQKEAYFFAVPCVTLRTETEWLETLQGKWNQLTGMTPEKALAVAHGLWSQNGKRPATAPDLAAFGGGDASARVVQRLLEFVKGLN